MRRASFVTLCGGALAATQLAERFTAAASAAEFKEFNRVKLVDAAGNSLRAQSLFTTEAYIFRYPYNGTPCFLIDLGKRPGSGGVGPRGTIVAFTAICAHQLSYPTPAASPIAYSPGESHVAGRSGVIVCCAHLSVYDPAHDARVVSGPAPQPLTAIALEYAALNDELYATGVIGGDRFEDFFKAFKGDLVAALGPGVARRLVAETTTVVPMSKFTTESLYC